MSNQTTSTLRGFFSAPDGPYLVARIIAVSSGATSPREISQVAWLDVRFDHAITTQWSVMQTRRYGPPPPDTDLPHHPPCGPGDLRQVVIDGDMPNVLVALDLAGTRMHFSPEITGHLPWIGILRVYRSLCPEIPSHDVRRILESRNLLAAYKKIPIWGGEPKCLRDVAMMAVLVEDLLSSPCRRVAGGAQADGDQLLGSVLGDLSAPEGLQALLRTSAKRFYPRAILPGSQDDVSTWAAMPLDDLLCYRDHPSTESERINARTELQRRVGNADFVEAALPEPRFLIRRKP